MDFISGETFYIDKPHGWTSFDVVKRLRSTLIRRMKVKKIKVGHAGTLDPLATGVMIVVTGRSTKLIEQLQAGVKEYVHHSPRRHHPEFRPRDGNRRHLPHRPHHPRTR